MSLVDERSTVQGIEVPTEQVEAPRPTRPSSHDRPRRAVSVRPEQVGELLGSMLSAGCLTWLLFFALTPLRGSFGAALTWYALFTVIYWFVEHEAHGALVARDRVATTLIVSAGIATMVPLVLIIGTTLVRGLPNLTPTFFTEDLGAVGPLDPATSGGARHSIIGTLQQTLVALVLSVPLAILTSVFLTEVAARGRLARVVRFLVDALSGLPSIVAGLFIYSALVLQIGFSGFAAGVALSILMLPIVIRTAVEVLRLVPDGLREASLALGVPRWRTVLSVVLPTARSGVITAVILGLARIVGETAPVLMTAFGSPVVNTNPFDGAQDNLTLFIWRQIRSSSDADVDRAWIGALVLCVLVLVLFTAARVLGSRGPGRRRRPIRLRRADPPVIELQGAPS